MKPTLSRTEIIASYAYAGTPPPPPAKTPPAPEAKPDASDVDAQMTEAIGGIETAVANAIALQQKDPDGTSDPNDAKVLSGLEALQPAVAAIKKDQAADQGGENPPPPADSDAAATPPAPAPAPPPAAIDATAICQTPGCGHPASAHADGDMGDNTGACSTPGCMCEAMAADADTPPGDDGEPQNASIVAADLPPVPAPAKPPASGDASLNAPPEIAGSDAMGAAFTIPCGVIEGQPTSDGRTIAVGALTWRTPPLPLMFQPTTTHDPRGMDQNAPAVLAGRIDSLSRTAGEEGTALIVAHGFYLANEDGQAAADATDALGRMGISVDVAVQAEEVTITDTDDEGWPTDMAATLTEGEIMGFTQVPYAAFPACYIVLGDGTADDTIPQQDPAMTASAQLVHLMSFEECEACDQGLEVIVASAAGPERPPAGWFENPHFDLGDGRLVEIFSKRGRREGKYACPVTVTDQGQIYGHLAPFGVCHTGLSGQCILAPRSKTDYAFFKRGAYIVSAEGQQIRVGVLTAETGHAPTSGISASGAMAHYDNTGLAYADINVGEDDYGIWVAGAVRPNATPEQIRSLTAAAPSGDWREQGGSLELVAVLCVNQPGFPVVPVPEAKVRVASGHVTALVAAGASVMDRLGHPLAGETPGDPVLRAAMAPMLREAATRARERLALR